VARPRFSAFKKTEHSCTKRAGVFFYSELLKKVKFQILLFAEKPHLKF
jgi:hypothetical protein